jgi:hypothetical protein
MSWPSLCESTLPHQQSLDKGGALWTYRGVN